MSKITADPIKPERLEALRCRLRDARQRDARPHHVAGVSWQDVSGLIAEIDLLTEGELDGFDQAGEIGRAQGTYDLLSMLLDRHNTYLTDRGYRALTQLKDEAYAIISGGGTISTTFIDHLDDLE